MNIVKRRVMSRPVVAVMLALQTLMYGATVLFAQTERKVDVDVDIDSPGGAGAAWYGNWWIWAIGIAVFLIIIVALTNRGGGRSEA